MRDDVIEIVWTEPICIIGRWVYLPHTNCQICGIRMQIVDAGEVCHECRWSWILAMLWLRSAS